MLSFGNAVIHVVILALKFTNEYPTGYRSAAAKDATKWLRQCIEEFIAIAIKFLVLS